LSLVIKVIGLLLPYLKSDIQIMLYMSVIIIQIIAMIPAVTTDKQAIALLWIRFITFVDQVKFIE